MSGMHTLLNWVVIAVLTSLGLSQARAAETTLDVLYAFDRTTAATHSEIKTRFEAENPDIRVNFLAQSENYEALTQTVLRGALINDLPDVVFEGQNLIRVLVDRGLAAPLDHFIAGAGGPEKLGFDASLLRIGARDGKTFGIPFAISTPVICVNLDLLKRAGVEADAFPTTWDAIVALGKRLDDPKAGVTGFYFQWDITGNWMLQSLVFANGGSMLSDDEKTVALDQPAGRQALETLESFAKAGMPNLPSGQARSAFAAGKIAIFADSTSNLGKATVSIGTNFAFRTYPFPLPAAGGRLPAGGNSAVMLTKDAEKQKAAWKYIAFATGPIGETIMARHTGYLPGNRIAITTPDLLGDFYAGQPNFQTA
jgi:multiple sugar transport system substrate-binding protein